MKVGIVSDTHGNLSGLLDLVDYLLNEVKADKIFHLGDNYSDIDELFSLKRSLIKGSTDYSDHDFLSDVTSFMKAKDPDAKLDPASLINEDEITKLKRIIVRVPEDGNSLLKAGEIAKTALEMIGDRIATLVHNVKTLKKEDIEGSDIVLYGGTHKHQVDNLGGRWFINPGHFMEEDNEGKHPTFGVLETTSQGLTLTIYSTDRTKVLSRTLTFGPRTKMTVK